MAHEEGEVLPIDGRSVRKPWSLAFLLACLACTVSSGCIVGIASPREDGDDGGPVADGSGASESSVPSDATGTPDAPQDVSSGDAPTQGSDGGASDGSAESAADASGDAVTQDVAPPTQYLVFVTSTTYQGNVGGLAGADAKCQSRAAAASPSPLPGTFLAWVSDSTTSAASHITTHAAVPYVMVDGTVVASDWSALTSANGSALQHMITLDENGDTVPSTDVCSSYDGHFVWTNSNDDGSIFDSTQTCQDLTSNASTDEGNTGSASNDQMNTMWWSNWCNGQSCDTMASLYCIQQ